MANCLDVAAYILTKKAPLTTIKLQKLVYYSQAWSLVWDDAPLFPDRIEAWANGPVAPRLFFAHKGKYQVYNIPEGYSGNLTQDQKDTIDAVLSEYGDKSSHWLVELTHLEAPWKEARGTCPLGDPCDNEISHASMSEYYSGL